MKQIFSIVTAIGLIAVTCFQLHAQPDWNTTGNATIAGDFLGSTNAQDLNFNTFNTTQMTIIGVNNMAPWTNNFGWVGINNNMPMSMLHLGQTNCYNGQTCASGLLRGGWRNWMQTGMFMCQGSENA